jgi:hypothetical protein
LYAGLLVLVAWGIYRSMQSLPDREGELALLGRALLAVMVAIMVIIFTVSSVGLIPIVLWSVAGLGVAYAHMVNSQTRLE